MNRTWSLFSAVLLLTAVLMGAVFMRGSALAQDKTQPKAALTKWEYKVMTFTGVAENMEDSLNKLGEAGWECVSAVSRSNAKAGGGPGGGAINNTAIQVILKRLKQ